MKQLTHLLKNAALSTLLASTIGTSLPASGAGFQISETSVAGLGRANAGNGVSGETISDMYTNPASLSLREGSEVEIGGHFLDSEADYIDQGSTLTFGSTTVAATGPNSDGGKSAIIPNLYISGDITDALRYGLGINVPFGLATEYDSNWVGRYAAVETELKTIEVNPTLSYDFGATSIGVGLSFIHGDGTLTNAQFTGPGSPDAMASLSGSDSAVGYTLGIVGENAYGRVGVGFRSRMKLDIDGILDVMPSGRAPVGASASIVLPKSFYLSGLWKITDSFDLLGSLRITDWEQFDELRIEFDNGLMDSVVPENWDTTTTTSLGFNYRPNDTWTYRAGIAFDQSAGDDADRTARIPEEERWWLSMGGSYNYSQKVRVDFGYARILVKDATLDETTNLVASSPASGSSNLRGKYESGDSNIFSIGVAIKTGGVN